MAEPIGRAVSLLLVAAAAAGLIGCARPVGDFGRARASFTHDRLLPAIGEARAELAGEPVSDFNQTDAEQEMHNRVWRFLVAAHAKDWSFDMATEMRRTRIGPDAGKTFGIERYYRWLSRTEFKSSPGRYRRMVADIEADIATLPGTFAAICAVQEVDRQRAIAAETGAAGPKMEQEARDRFAENGTSIAWFTAALGYRFASYEYGLDHLLIETPHEEAREVDEALSGLAIYVRSAQRGEFCGSAGGSHRVAGAQTGRARVLISAPSEGEFSK